MEPSQSVHDRACPLRIGRYLLFDAIASGGMATVHYGRLVGPAGFSRVVAIKRLHAHLTREPGFVAMLLDEARLAARVRHPNVVAVLDIAELPDELCLVMEYVDGEALSTLQRSLASHHGRVPAPIAASVMVGALSGLHAAHEASNESGVPLGIVHRDVSPQNILLGRDGLARVLDFGIAFAAERIQVTRDGQIKGKLAYMAPEQVLGGKLDRRTDVYAAAVVLWELLAGRRLYLGENTAHTMHLITSGEPPAPSSVEPSIPPRLDEVVLRGLARDPERRFSTAAEMAFAIEECIGVASHQQAAAWLGEVAGESLAMRARKVTDVETYVDDGEQRPFVREPASESRVAPAPKAARMRSSEETEVATADEAPAFSAGPVPGNGLQGPGIEVHAEFDATTGVREPSPARAGMALWVAAALVLAILAAGILTVFVRRGEPSPQGPATVAATVSALPLVMPGGDSERALPDATPSASAVAQPGSPPQASASAPSPPRTGTRGATPARTRLADCEPPYTIDKSGVRVPKRECF